MKKLQMVLVLAHTLTSLNAHAVQINEPGIHKAKLMMSESELIQAVKNDRSTRMTSPTTLGFGDAALEAEQLEELLQSRLREVESLTFFRDLHSLDNALTFSALAFQAWNPELRAIDIKTQIVRNIVNFGFMEGFLLPTMSIIDLSYATGKPNFGNLLNSMLAEITPNFGKGLSELYSVPVEVEGRTFLQISQQGRAGMWQALITELDSSFFANHVQFSKQDLITRALLNDLDPMNSQDKTMNHFLNKTLRSDSSFLSHYLKQNQHNANSNIGNIKERDQSLKKGVFSNASATDAKSCQARCNDEIVKRLNAVVVTSTAIGGAIGSGLGAYFAGPLGIVMGIKKGGAIGAAAGVVIGGSFATSAGLVECRASVPCVEEKKQEESQKKKEQEIALKKQKEDRERDEKAKKLAADKKKAEDAKKQHAEDAKKRIQEEARKEKTINETKQAELDKKTKEKQTAEQKRVEEVKEKQIAETQRLVEEQRAKERQIEAAKKSEDAKKKQDEADAKKKKEDQDKEEDEVVLGPMGKTMITEDESSGVSLEEVQKMKKDSISAPMAPEIEGLQKTFTPSNMDMIIKTVVKEKHANPIRVNSIYPTDPNLGD